MQTRFHEEKKFGRKSWEIKARLVANGSTEQFGIDYDETSSLVVQIQSIQIILSLVAYYDYELFQMDVKMVYLNEDIYWTTIGIHWEK